MGHRTRGITLGRESDVSEQFVPGEGVIQRSDLKMISNRNSLVAPDESRSLHASVSNGRVWGTIIGLLWAGRDV